MKPRFDFQPARYAAPLALLLMTAQAQSQAIRIVPIPPPAVAEAPKVDAPVVEAVPPAEETLTAAEKLSKKLRDLKFDRSPEAVLAATKTQRTGAEIPPEESFNMSVMFGDWAAVGKTLATLPKEDAAAIYENLIETLAEQAVPVGEVLKTPDLNADEEDPYERMNRLRNEQNKTNKKAAPILSEDFYGIVDAAPGDIVDKNIPALTKIAKTALGEGGRTGLLDKLKAGWKGLGGESPEGRKLATSFLSAMGWIKDAAPFLPLKSEEWADADTTQLVFAMEYFTQAGIADRDERQLQRAAEICALLMKTARFGNYTRPQFRLAMDRMVQLLPALGHDQALKLIREQLFKQTATLADLISIIAQLGQEIAKGNDVPARAASLGTQHLLLEAMTSKKDELPSNVAVLVLNWLAEAEGCYRAGGVVATDMSQAERMMMRRYGMSRQLEVNTLSTEQILSTAPPLELISRLNPGLAQRVQLTMLKVQVLQPEEANLDLLRDYVKKHPGLEREICQDVLAGWVSKRTKPAESQQVKQMRAYGMYVPPQLLQQGSGIPLTRLRQNQNIDHFKTLLTDLREISPEPLDPALIVQAFMTLHSGAEVYRLDDIIAIFGPPEKMVRKEVLELLDGMRGRLGEQWRDPKAQQQAGTNRTEQEAKDEVSRGYKTALELAKRGIRAEDADWESFITRGQLIYDTSQYEFERKVKLSEYVNLRDEAFSSFRKAAEIYAAKVPEMPQGQWNILPYQSWFFVMLGASDLAQLTTNTARTDPGLQSIGDAMRALPGEAADKHLEMFAKMLGELFPRVPANVRQRFLGSGLKIVGESHPAASAATKSLDYYKELLDEIQLRITVDGPTRVGHGQPFGAFIGLETTHQLLRESGGFSKYLQNRASQSQAMSGGQPQGGPNLRDDFTKNIHAALDETFEVISLTFHDSAVKAINLPREGWVQTPLVYAVLRAKNAAVDRIPSIQIDMDFIDQPGQVVLPVMSQVQPLDARDATVENRPCGELALNLTMDEREWNEGRVIVEIQARGQGVIPKLEELFDCDREGFTLDAVDGNLSVTQLTSDGSAAVPQADRNWQLTYRRKPDLRGDVRFPFPKLKDGVQPTTLEYKHYQDADLATIDAAEANRGIKLVSNVGTGPRNGVIAALLALTVSGFVWLMRRGKKISATVSEELAAPANPTPFSTVAFLHRILSHHGERLSDNDRSSINSQIKEIESGYFSGGQAPSIDLSAIVNRWLGVVRKACPSRVT
jgi:hypothetical protein